MKKIKVLIVSDSMNIGGLENQLMHLLRNADKSRFQIDYVCRNPDAYYRKEIEGLGGGFYTVPKMRWKKPQEYCRALYQVMKDGGYDVVHSNELFHSGIVLRIAYKAGIKKRIAHSHSFSDGDGLNSRRTIIRSIYNAIMRHWILKYSTDQIACATTAGKFMFGEKGIKRDSFHLIYNSIDTTKYIEEYDQKETGEYSCDGWINVLHVGRVYPVKRQLFDVDIAEKFKDSGKKIRILCAGNAFDESYMKHIQSQIREKNLQEYMIMLGSRDDVDVLFRKSAVAILPSVYEGMPLVLIEAQASGLPCVASDTFSHEVDFDIGMVKWLPCDATAEEWVNAIECAVSKGRTEKELVVNAIEEKKFDSRKFAEAVCNIYAGT